MECTDKELKYFVEFSKDFNGFEKVEVKLPTEVIEKIQQLSQEPENSDLGFDGTLVALLWSAIEKTAPSEPLTLRATHRKGQ